MLRHIANTPFKNRFAEHVPDSTNPTFSVFDPASQHGDPDAKITAALDRLGHAFRSMLSESARQSDDGHGLSSLQAQSLVFLHYHGASLSRVTQLAREFEVTPATVSDAVRVLVEKGLVRKEQLPDDRRVAILQLTPNGKQVATRLSGWADVVKHHVAETTAGEREIVLRFLLNLIGRLTAAGAISVARTCVTCRYFAEDAHPGANEPHHCRLMNLALAELDLRIDCQEHETETAHTS